MTITQLCTCCTN